MSNTAPTLPSDAGKTVYVGIDGHKPSDSVVTRMNHSEVKRWTMTADPQKLGEQLRQFFCRRNDL